MNIFKAGLKPPPLIRVLKNVLEQNPDNGQILKELLQNAEDAGATEVKFLLDCTTHGKTINRLVHSDLADFQGPALYAYNNAEFKDEDWEGICMINHSVKENNPQKIGRFGVGFKSVFHMTDFPGILSGSIVGFIDPHEKYFIDSTGRAATCDAWDLNRQLREIQSHADQFQPFLEPQLFGTSWDTFRSGCYKGKTLFRFPLRSKGTKLSETTYTPDKVRELFGDLEKDADIILLFMTNIEKIEIFEKTSDGQIIKTLEIKITDTCVQTVRRQRQTFLDMTRNPGSLAQNYVTFPIEIEVSKNAGRLLHQSRWMLSLYYGEDALQHDESQLSNFACPMRTVCMKLGVLPWVGAALKVPERTEPAARVLEIPTEKSCSNGRIFCFLPLPLEEHSPTGLACHVNGTFSLDQSRQHVKWPNADQHIGNITDYSIRWNIFLIRTLIPAAMIKLALRLTEGMPKRPDLIYSLMPDMGKLRPNWKQVAEIFYQQVLRQRHRLFYARNIEDYCPIDNNTVIASNETPEPISQFLLRADVHPIILPEHVLKAFEKLKPKFKRVSPSYLAEILRAKLDHVVISDDSKIQLLTYLLEANGNTINLTDVQLVPLADGSWSSFGIPKQKTLFRIPTNSELSRVLLLPGPSQSFIRPGLPHIVSEGLDKHVKKGELTPAVVLQLINKIEGITASHEWVSSNNNQDLTMECLDIIWRYLRHECNASLPTVETLGLHLIPVDGCQHLATLNRSMSLLQVNDSMESSLIDLFRILEIVQLRNLPTFITSHPYIVNQYVFLASATGVLGVLRRVEETQGSALLVSKISQAPVDCKSALRHFLEKNCHELSKISLEDKNFIKILPMFQTQEDSGFESSHFVTAMNCKGVYMFPKGISVPDFLLDLDDTDTRKFAIMLNIEIVGNLSMIVNSVFPGINGRRYERKIMECTMKAILTFCSEMIKQDPYFNSQLQKVKFIQKNDSEFASASELYDRDDPAVVALFEGEEKFPVGEFSQPQYKQLLKSIGLKGNDNIGLEDLIGLAQEIHQRPDDRKAERLMEAVEVKAKSFNDTKHRDQKKVIQKFSWIKPRQHRGPNYPASLTFVNQLSSPSRVYSDEYINLVGSVAATVNIGTKWMNLANLFLWNAAPETKDVVEHFLNVTEWYKKQSSICQSELKEKQMTSESNYQKLAQRIFDDIYTFLEQSLKDTAKKTMVSNQLRKLSDKPCVLVDTWLMIPSRCAFDCDFSQLYLPYMGSIPKTTSSNYEELMKALGVKKAFEGKDYIDVLEDFHNVAKENPLEHEKIKLVLHIVNESLMKHDLTKKAVFGKVVYIPDDNRILHPSSVMWYNPNPEAANCQTAGMKTGNFPCHPGVKEPAVNKFDIQSKAKALLKPFVQPFGQKEKLVARLRRFLETNPYSMETLKELIQNADDAGATKLHFIIDPRSLPDANVFHESWKPLQGPALSIFSNSQFTEADLQGIQDLGEGSKSVDLTKIGQYGVGFNCVYHLTDAPTVLTKVGNEEKLCVLDPMMIHAPFASPNSPGCMFTHLDELKQRFPDVFAGYLEKEYGVGSGTVFRYALRKQKSDLSDQVFSIQDLENSLMQFFKENIHDYLLFLNNISEIALNRVNAKTQEIESLFVVTRELESTAMQRVQHFQEAVKKYVNLFQKDKINNLPTSNQIDYEVRLKDNQGKEETWLIVQRLGFEHFQQLPDTVRKSYESSKLNLLPLVGVAYLLYGNKESRSRKSRMFCFLPLPVCTGLPVHVNGHFALDHDNRRALLNEEIGGQKKGWNMYLLQHIIPPAYCSLICAVRDKWKTKCNIDLKQYHLLFPQVKQCDDRHSPIERIEHAVSLAVYDRIGSRNADLLPVTIAQGGGTELAILWFKPLDEKNYQTGYFDSLSEFNFSHPPKKDQYSRTSDTERAVAEDKFRDILTKCGFNLFASPMKIYDNFTAAGVKVKKISPETVLQFLSGKNADIFSAFSQSDIVSSVCQILRYCSQWEEFKEHLLGTPLQITQDGSISVFNQRSIKFASDHSAVAPHALNCFIHSQIAQAAKLSTSADNMSKKPDSALCKHFGIADFEKLLPSLLPETEFRGLDKKVKAEFLTDLLSKWPRGKGEPDKAWIKKVWDFLGYEVAMRNVKRKSSDLPIADFARQCLMPLNDWCLLPVTSEAHGDLLMPVKRASTIMTDSIKKQLQSDIISVLQKLGFSVLKIDKGVRETNATWVLSLLMDKEHQHPSVFVLEVLHQLILQPIPEISSEEQKILLTFLSKNVKEIEKSENFLATVKKLPYFELSSGNQDSMDGCMAYILPENIPETGSDIWISAARLDFNIQKLAIKFFRYNSHVLDLIRALGCRELSPTEVYCTFIFKHFDKISATGRYLHMKFIKENLIQNVPPNQRKQLQVSLRSLLFIRDNETAPLCTANRYVDPRVELFKVMEDEFSFPPKPFDKDDWLEFLVQNCGLISEVSESKLLAYATKLAKAPPREDQQLRCTSCYLLAAIVNHKKLSFGFIENIKSIPFIVQHVPPNEILSLHPQHCSQNNGSFQLVPFYGSYAASCSDYVWSNRFLLPPDATYNKSAFELRPEEKSLLQKLGVVLQPSSDDIAEHLKNLCRRISPREKIESEIDRVLKANFTSLEELGLNQLSNCVTTLKGINCVRTNEGFLVKPNQVVIDIAKEIPPHLYKLHIELGSHHRLLTKLGVHEVTTPYLYASILSDVYEKYNTMQLSSEDHKVAFKATRGFLELLNAIDEKEVECSLRNLQKLYLPCSDKCLHPSIEVVVPDNKKISLGRLKYFQHPVIDNRSCSVAPSQTQSSPVDCFRKIPSRLRCKFLTSIVTEKLQRNFKEAVVGNAPRELIAALERNIRTPEFAEGVARLISHLLSGSQNPGINNINSEVLRSKLSHLKILIVDHVITHLEERGGSVIRESEERCSHFLEENTIYVSQEFCNSQSTEMKEILHIRIAEALNSIMDNSIEPILVYLPLILKCGQSEIDRRLNEIQIPQLMRYREVDNESDYDTADEDESHLRLGQHDARPDLRTGTLGDSGNHRSLSLSLSPSHRGEDNSMNRSNSPMLDPFNYETWEMQDDYEGDSYGDGIRGVGGGGGGGGGGDYSDDDDHSDDGSDDFHAHDEPDSRAFTYHPSTSRKWIEQAGHDLRSGQDDSRARSFEWSCYKFHQAAEKALKAVLIYRNKEVPLSHNLCEVTENFPEADIKQQAQALQLLLRNTSSMRYPSRNGRTPHESLSSEVSMRAERFTNRIFEWAVINT